MILINQFPTHSYSLSQPVNDMKIDGFTMNICWFYNSEDALNVAIKVEKDSHYSLLAAWLSSNGYTFSMEADESCFNYSPENGHKRYILCPKQGHPAGYVRTSILCAGLLKTNGGKLNMTLALDISADTTSYQAILEASSEEGLKEISSALGMIGRPYKVSEWYSSDPQSILVLPHCGSRQDMTITTGYGKNQAKKTPQDSDIILGNIYNDILDRSLCFTAENLTSSTCIFGAPGYGKSTLISSILWQIWAHDGIPFIVLEPKQEYRRLQKLIPEMIIIDSATIMKTNPLLPPQNMSHIHYIDILLELIELISPSSPESTHRDYFRDAYFRWFQTGSGKVETFLKTYDKIMEGRYTGEALNFVKAGRHKLEAFFTAWAGPDYLKIIRNQPLSLSRFMEKPMVIEIGDVATTKLKSAFAYYFFQQIRGFIRNRASKKIQNVLVLEEAHMLLDPSAPIEIRREVGNAMAEDRARGLSLIVTDQSPSRLDMTQMGLAGNSFSFRLQSSSDRAAVAEQLGVSSDDLNNMQKQQSWVRLNTSYCPVKVKVKVDEKLLE